MAEPTDEATRIFLFQAVRELLLNVVKHAQARSARVDLTVQDDDHIRLVVSDTGIGFDQSALASSQTPSGLGLFSIRERLVLLGGRLTVESTPGQGSRVILEIPRSRPTASPIVASPEQDGAESMGRGSAREDSGTSPPPGPLVAEQEGLLGRLSESSS